MYPEEYTLTESISNTDSHSSTSGEEEFDDSEDDRWVPVKVVLDDNET